MNGREGETRTWPGGSRFSFRPPPAAPTSHWYVVWPSPYWSACQASVGPCSEPAAAKKSWTAGIRSQSWGGTGYRSRALGMSHTVPRSPSMSRYSNGTVAQRPGDDGGSSLTCSWLHVWKTRSGPVGCKDSESGRTRTYEVLKGTWVSSYATMANRSGAVPTGQPGLNEGWVSNRLVITTAGPERARPCASRVSPRI